MPFAGDPLAFYGKRLIEEYHATLLKQLPPFRADPDLSNPFGISDESLPFLPHLKVGILGAGLGGMYTALILDSLDIDYDIIESSDRAGGRFITYKFQNGGKYDYYDQGAMRFPLPTKDTNGQYKNGIMKRLADLIEYGPLNEGRDRLKDKLIPYYPSARDGSKPGFYYFNGILEQVSSKPKGSFDAEGMNVDSDYAQAGADAIVNDVLNPFVRMLVDDLQTNKTTGWDVLKANDTHSARSYMALKYIPSDSLKLPPQHLPTTVINWCALLGSIGAATDRALAESVLDSLGFAQVGNSDFGQVDWKSFEGGSEVLTKKMEEYITKKSGAIQFHKRVTAIGQGSIVVSLPGTFPRHKLPSCIKKTHSETVDIVIDEDQIGAEAVADTTRTGPLRVEVPCVTVTLNETETRSYSHVISTLSLPVLRIVDLTDAGLNVMQKNALRALDYGPLVKIAVLFKSDWWTTKLGIVGGQSFTDLPIRTIVYPSYGVDSTTPSKVLIACYCWTTDAFRMSSLASQERREVLKELVLHNLAQAHGALNSEITYEYLKEQYVDMNIKDWNQDPHSMGAYAYFSPGEFEDLYTSLNFPAANNRLHFAGEAISTRHSWAVGALDSAWKAVYQYLKITRQNEKLKKFKEIWGENLEWTSPSTLVDPAQYGDSAPDILDQHLGLVNKAILGGVVTPRRV